MFTMFLIFISNDVFQIIQVKDSGKSIDRAEAELKKNSIFCDRREQKIEFFG